MLLELTEGGGGLGELRVYRKTDVVVPRSDLCVCVSGRPGDSTKRNKALYYFLSFLCPIHVPTVKKKKKKKKRNRKRKMDWTTETVEVYIYRYIYCEIGDRQIVRFSTKTFIVLLLFLILRHRTKVTLLIDESNLDISLCLKIEASRSIKRASSRMPDNKRENRGLDLVSFTSLPKKILGD